MTFFKFNEAPSPYQIDQRDRHTNLIKSITNIGQSKAQTLAEYLQLREIQDIPDPAIAQIGFSQTQINRLRAAYDFGKSQFLGIQQINLEQAVDDPAIAAKLIQELIGDSRVEKGCLLILNVKHHLLHRAILSIGTETECLINARRIFEAVLKHGGTRFIYSHNHPSGSLEPSSDDIEATRNLYKAASCMEIPMLDHLIVSRDQFMSLRQTTGLWD